MYADLFGSVAVVSTVMDSLVLPLIITALNYCLSHWPPYWSAINYVCLCKLAVSPEPRCMCAVCDETLTMWRTHRHTHDFP